MKRQPCLWLLLAVAGGVIVDRHLEVGLPIWSGLGICFCISWLVAHKLNRWGIGAAAILMIAGAVGGAWHHLYWFVYPANEVSHWVEQDGGPLALIGVTETESRYLAPDAETPMTYDALAEKTLVELRAESVRVNDEWVPCGGRLIVLVKQRVRIKAGERLQIFGIVKPCGEPRNPGEFDFRGRYRARRILAWLYCENSDAITQLDRQTWGFKAIRSQMRGRLDQLLWERLPSERAGFASAILLGNREQLATTERDQFMLTGTVHLLAISGLHLGILAGVVLWFSKFLPISRLLRYLIVIGLVFFYAWLVEFRPPVSRAALLIIMMCCGRLLGRGAFSINSLCLAGLAVLALNPTDLFSIGPQFSFLAVFSLGILRMPEAESDPVDRLIQQTRPWGVQRFQAIGLWCGQALWVSLVLTLTTLPLTAHYFNLVVPMGVLANPLVLLPMSFSLFGGLMVMVFGEWFGPLAALGAWICDLSLWSIQQVVGTGSRFTWGHWWLTGPTSASVLVFYGIYLLLGIRFPKFWNLRRICFWLVAWVGIAWLGPAAWVERQSNSERQGVEVVVIDVGHGTAVLVQTSEGKNLLFDAGSAGSAHGGARRIASVLRSRGINHLHAVFVSHADVDHYNALPILFKQFSVNQIFVAPNVFDAKGATIEKFQNTLLSKFHEIQLLTRGMELELGDAQRLQVLGPAAYPKPGSNNSDSLVLEVQAFGRRLLLPGDIEPPGLWKILQTPTQPVDVTLAPHHGSMGSQPIAYTRWSRPKLVVISGLKSRVKPQVFDLYCESGAEVLATGNVGAVFIHLSESGVKWRGFIQDGKRKSSAAFYEDRILAR